MTTPPENPGSPLPQGEEGSQSATETAVDETPAARSATPWQGKATRTDKALVWTLATVTLLLLVMWPLRPFLISSQPVLLAFVSGSKAAIGAVAAFAEAGRYPIWLAVAAGVFGIAKLDWLFWWTGRQWGSGIIGLFAPGDGAKRLAQRAQTMNPWLIRLCVVFARVPGVPSALVYSVAGWTGMRLTTFLFLNLLGVLVVTVLVVAAGYSLGEHAIDLIVMIENYAIWFSLAIILLLVLIPVYRSGRSAAKENQNQS